MIQHHYRTNLRWTGSNGQGTTSYTGYSRAFELSGPDKATIAGSSDPAFRGEASRWNPEELLVGALSACHQLWYLHLCATAGLKVLAYQDHAEGTMEEESGGAGQFSRIVLRPEVTLAPGSDSAKARALHADASRMCFIERSLNCEVVHEPVITVGARAELEDRAAGAVSVEAAGPAADGDVGVGVRDCPR